MELEPSSNIEITPPDGRPLIPEPLPVRMLTIEDARLLAPAGIEVDLDLFYIGILQFVRDPGEPGITYRADNYRLRFEVVETPDHRESLRALLIEVPRLLDLEHRLVEEELDYTRQRGLMPGNDRLVLRDPAGNWLEISEYRPI